MSATASEIGHGETIRRKLSPTVVKYGRDGKMAAIVACIIGEEWTTPALHGLTVTSDDFVLGCRDGMANHFIGELASLRDNWKRLLDFAELTEIEKEEANALFLRTTGRAAT